MGTLVTVVVALALLAAVVFILKHRGQGQRSAAGAATLPYRPKDALLSKAEHSFFQVLEHALDPAGRVFVKVRLLDLVWIPRDASSLQTHRNRVMSKHVDFVLCSRDGLRPMLVIELDDASHHREDRAARDSFVDQVLKSAGIPILHVPAQRSYVVAELMAQIRALVTPPAPPVAQQVATAATGSKPLQPQPEQRASHG